MSFGPQMSKTYNFSVVKLIKYIKIKYLISVEKGNLEKTSSNLKLRINSVIKIMWQKVKSKKDNYKTKNFDFLLHFFYSFYNLALDVLYLKKIPYPSPISCLQTLKVSNLVL